MFALDMRITTRLAGAGARLFIAILVLLPTKGTNASSKRTALTAADFEKMIPPADLLPRNTEHFPPGGRQPVLGRCTRPVLALLGDINFSGIAKRSEH